MRMSLGCYLRDFYYYLILSFRRTFQFEGRASRAEFWCFQLCLYPLAWLEMFLENRFPSQAQFFEILFLLICPTIISLSCRRLHDCDLSGWWQLLYPLIAMCLLPILRYLLVPFFIDLSWKGISSNPWWILEGNIVSLILLIAFYGKTGDEGPNHFGQTPPSRVRNI